MELVGSVAQECLRPPRAHVGTGDGGEVEGGRPLFGVDELEWDLTQECLPRGPVGCCRTLCRAVEADGDESVHDGHPHASLTGFGMRSGGSSPPMSRRKGGYTSVMRPE